MYIDLNTNEGTTMLARTDWEAAYVLGIHSWTNARQVATDEGEGTIDGDALPTIQVRICVPDHEPRMFSIIFVGVLQFQYDFRLEIQPVCDLKSDGHTLRWHSQLPEPAVVCRRVYCRWSSDVDRIEAVIFRDGQILIDGEELAAV